MFRVTLISAAALVLSGFAAPLEPGMSTDIASLIRTAQAAEETAASGVGTVNSVGAAARKINLTHEPLPEIGWPKMTMDFAVAEGIDLDAVAPGDAVRFSLSEAGDGSYVITAIETESR
ncbi:MAG: cation transporter [Rhodospirillaceae bacterium]|nr:cation transporter [Rhodospirillaceae bacterium]|tara:strand:+ start:171 stop:527 length:357 start_codon:yes stop_codon:yes gene_type:complete